MPFAGWFTLLLFVHGDSEVDAFIRGEPQVVGGTEGAAFDLIDEDGLGAVVLAADDATVARLAENAPAFLVDHNAVGKGGVASADFSDPFFGGPAVDGAVFEIAEVECLLTDMPGGTFGETETVSEFYHFRVRGDKVGEIFGLTEGGGKSDEEKV